MRGLTQNVGLFLKLGGTGGGGYFPPPPPPPHFLFKNGGRNSKHSVDTSVGLTLGNHYNADWTINTFLSAKVKFMPATTTSNALQ